MHLASPEVWQTHESNQSMHLYTLENRTFQASHTTKVFSKCGTQIILDKTKSDDEQNYFSKNHACTAPRIIFHRHKLVVLHQIHFYMSHIRYISVIISLCLTLVIRYISYVLHFDFFTNICTPKIPPDCLRDTPLHTTDIFFLWFRKYVPVKRKGITPLNSVHLHI